MKQGDKVRIKATALEEFRVLHDCLSGEYLEHVPRAALKRYKAAIGEVFSAKVLGGEMMWGVNLDIEGRGLTEFWTYESCLEIVS